MVKSKKEKFQRAIRNSLEELLGSGEHIIKQAVIDNARFENGRQVGKTTLYSRHEITKEYVHADLLKEIDEVIQSQRKKLTGKTKAESMVDLRSQITLLKEENKKLVDQIVEQEARLKNVESSTLGENHIIANQEIEIYVLGKLVNELANGAVGEIKLLVNRFEEKYRGEELLVSANKEIERYKEKISHSRLVSLESVTKVKM